jgi:citrate synthase
MSKATTRIGSSHSDTGILKIRGKDTLSEIAGHLSFSETFFLIVTGRLPTPAEARCFDACMTILMDHGLTSSALVARLTDDAVPDDIQVSVAAGLLLVGNRHVGTMAGAGRLLADGMAEDGDRRAWAAATVARYRDSRRRIPGFGHAHYKPEDPRATRLFRIADEAGCTGDYIALLHVLGEEIDRAAGRHLTLNVTGAMAAVLSEIGFPVAAMRGVAVVARAAGLVGHICEEKDNHLAREINDFVDREIAYEDPE